MAMKIMPPPRRWLLVNGAYLYVVFGGIGELVALLALFERSDALVWRVIVLIATLLLLSAVIGRPFFGYLRTVRDAVGRPGRGEGKASGAQANPAPSAGADREQHDAGASPDTGT